MGKSVKHMINAL